MARPNPSHADLEIVDNQYADRDYKIHISIPEFSCVCPRSGLPDYATIDIYYVPGKHIIELKSLKLYLVKFRDIGIFHEDVTNKILDDIKEASLPKNIQISGRFNPRGGIYTTVDASWPD